MKIALTVIGVLLVLVGIVWILQGINLLGGSSMTGQSVWAVNGTIAFIAGAALLFFTNRKKSLKP
jgi:uncharacterized membrane protein HdeD (DUF308 family)